jgi:hypothetical protein
LLIYFIVIYLSAPGPPRNLKDLSARRREIALQWQKPESVTEEIKSYTVCKASTCVQFFMNNRLFAELGHVVQRDKKISSDDKMIDTI